MEVVGGRVVREALLEQLRGEIDGLNDRIKVVAARRAADGIALSELRCERERLERHRASLLRSEAGEDFLDQGRDGPEAEEGGQNG